MLVGRYASKSARAKLTISEHSHIRDAHYLPRPSTAFPLYW